MDGIIMHERTASQLADFAASPHHALLLTGPDGIGKTTLARMLALQILALEERQLTNYPYFLLAGTENGGNISIEEVRRIHKFLQLKTTGSAPLRRIILMQHTDGLTTEAQNAFLKLLEEPPADTLTILTAHSKQSLLPTILSRVQIVAVYPPAQEVLHQHFTNAGQAADTINRAYFLSGGLPGLMYGLLQDDTEHPLLEQVVVAKELLQKSPFERLAMADTLAKQKTGIAPLLDALQRIASSGIKQAGEKQDTKALRRWHALRKEASVAQDAISKSANGKLTLTKMLLHM